MSSSVATLPERSADGAPRSAPASAPMSIRGRHWPRRLGASFMAATAAASVMATVRPDRPAAPILLTFLVYLSAGVVIGRASRWGSMLPLTRAVLLLAAPVAGGVLLFICASLTGVWEPHPIVVSITALAAAAGAFLARLGAHSLRPPERVVLIGSDTSTVQLRIELQAAGVKRYELLGCIAEDDDPDDPLVDCERLGTIASLEALVQEHAIDLLLVACSRSRGAVFEQIAECFLRQPVRVCELTQFYEDTLGHVPGADIDAEWFRYIMHPRFRSHDTPSKRALDLGVALIAMLVFAPVLIVCAALIKLHDGGPVLFTQRRIGNRGEPFTLLKLRSMSVAPATAAWSSADDPRVTPIGRLMRRTHIDELPQLLNVVRGDMSIVGPRPEQPEFVERLERKLAYYKRRHLIKPGLTGWAQVRSGYAGSDTGSARKLCHDLFYIKHRSLGLDLAILLETLRALVADRQYPVPVDSVAQAGPAFAERATCPEVAQRVAA